MKPAKPKPRRFGAHARAVMSDPRWTLLPLSARAAWLQLTDLADAMPEIRAPSRSPPDLATYARILSADADDVAGAVAALISVGVIESVSTGYRLRAY